MIDTDIDSATDIENGMDMETENNLERNVLSNADEALIDSNVELFSMADDQEIDQHIMATAHSLFSPGNSDIIQLASTGMETNDLGELQQLEKGKLENFGNLKTISSGNEISYTQEVLEENENVRTIITRVEINPILEDACNVPLPEDVPSSYDESQDSQMIPGNQEMSLSLNRRRQLSIDHTVDELGNLDDRNVKAKLDENSE